MTEPEQMEELLQRLKDGDETAREALFPLVYRQLHAMAQRRMSAEGRDHTLQPTALVNEAYLKIVSAKSVPNDRAHFLKIAAAAMRTILVDHARAKQASKRSAPGERLPLDDLVEALEARSTDLVQLDAALEKLAETDQTLAKLVELRFFSGCTNEESAEALGVSPRQTVRWFQAARAWLKRELKG